MWLQIVCRLLDHGGVIKELENDLLFRPVVIIRVGLTYFIVM